MKVCVMARFRIVISWIIILISFFLFQCSSLKVKRKAKRPYEYGWVPKSYKDIQEHYEKYAFRYNCQPGETIASIGAGNGNSEVTISCFVSDIQWCLEEIDTSRLYQFDDVLAYFEKLKGSPVDAAFDLVEGTTVKTNLPKGKFDRVLMINVFHEIIDRKPIMEEVVQLLKPGGEFVIMERMGEKAGQVHGDCKFPKLLEKDLLHEMNAYGFQLVNKQIGEKMSHLVIYTFTVDS
jgi:SAM-dependent methyltransferase